MANVTLPRSSSAESWLDHPILPGWQRLVALAAHWEIIAYASLVLLSFVLRIWDVGGRAMHHDESLHAYYAWKLFVGQGYTYDPLMHGPFQFEVVPLFYLLFGDSEASARLLAVLLGTVLVALPYFIRTYLGRSEALLASVMIAISPGLVYFSRFIRDDIYLACFTFVMFITIVRYLDELRPLYLYICSAAAALAMASMEAAYITFFIFGSFLVFEGLHEYTTTREGPVLSAVRRTRLDTWLMAAAIFVVITVLLYSTFFTNPTGIWDFSHPICLQNCLSLHPQWSTDRKDILGGIAYWLAQHSYQRGGQPWFYYILVLLLYEQLAVVFGLAGLILAAFRRSLFLTFLAWWAVLSFALYSWAGEKMPWLSIHITLPLLLLGAVFVGRILGSRRLWQISIAGTVFALLLALEIHSTFLLNFKDAADPTEMLIYVQTSQDVPQVVHEIGQLSQRPGTGGRAMTIGLDTNDVGGWPFLWYLRDYSSITSTTSFNGPVCGGQYCSVLLMLDPQFNQYGNALLSHYVAQKYRWNWWFPEDYKVWFPDHWSDLSLALQGKGQNSILEDLFGTPQDRSHLWDWLMYRRPFGDLGARYLYVLVRRDLVSGAKYFPTHSTGAAPITNPLPNPPTGIGSGQLAGPRGIAVDAQGNIYVADTLNHRVVVFNRQHRLLRTWGQVGAGPGQFNSNTSPQSLTIGPDGLVYIADTWNQRIQVFTPSGQLVREWGGGAIGSGPGQFYGPRAIAVSRSGRVYVADTGNKRIEVFSRTGTYLSSWGSPGCKVCNGPGQFNEPSSVALAPDGTVYVSDFWNQRIQAFSPAGQYLRSWSVPDWTPQSYDEPYLTVATATGHVFATDPQKHSVLEFTPDGRQVGTLGTSLLQLPIGIAIEPNGSLAVSDATANQVTMLPPSGNLAGHGVVGRIPGGQNQRVKKR